MVREFYTNLAPHVVKKVKVRGILVDFSVRSINEFYQLEPMDDEAYNRIQEAPNYLEVLRLFTNGQGEWKLNNEGYVVHFKAKQLAYIPIVWHHFITSRLILTTKVCKVTAKRTLLNYAIIQDIPFDVGKVIEDAILYNKDAKMNLGNPFLIYELCKKVGVPLDNNEAWIHPFKAIIVKKNKMGVPRSEEVYDSRNEPSDEEELRTYQSMFGMLDKDRRKVGQSFTQPPPSTAHVESDPVSPHPIED